MAARQPYKADPTTQLRAETNAVMNGGSVKSTPLSSRTNTTSSTPFLPTPIETLILAIFPVTLVLGSLYSVLTISPSKHPYNATTQAHDPATALSYFARKDNLLNRYFVKVGWFWTTVAFGLLQWTLFSLRQRGFTRAGNSSGGEAARKSAQAAARFALATGVWIAVTRSFFGPGIIDRSYVLTGGGCDLSSSPHLGPEDALAGGPMARLEKAAMVSGSVCRAAGGTWKGGHDISGHVFLLVLGAGMLVLEALPFLVQHVDGNKGGVVERQREQVELDAGAANVASAVVGNGSAEQTLGLGIKVALGTAAVKWWMLLMTAAFFHTWFEKFTGLLVAMGTLWTIYILPRAVPALRGIFGATGT